MIKTKPTRQKPTKQAKRGLFSPVSLVLACLLVSQSPPISALPQRTAESEELKVGRPILRILSGGEKHTYRVFLETGQYLRVVADQRGIDIELRIFGPQGQKLVEMDSPNNTQGPESAAVITEQAGDHRIEIVCLAKGAPKGQYQVRIEASRAPTEQDRQWILAQSAYTEGQQLLTQGTAESRRKSIDKYQEALVNWRAAGDQVMEAHALLCLGASWRGLGQLQKSLDCYGQALELQRIGEGRREEAYTLFTIGVVYSDLGEPQKSLDYYGRALSQQRAMADIDAEAQTLGSMGVAYFSLGDIHKALDYQSDALTVWQKINSRPQEALTLHNIGRVYEVIGEFQKALERYLQALDLNRALRDRKGEAEELNSIGHVNLLLGEWTKALNYYNQALSIWRATGDHRREAITLSNMGRAYASLDETTKALERYQAALKLHREVGNRLGEAVTIEKIGELYAALADPRKALESYEQALQLRRATGDRGGEASSLSNIGLLYTSLGDSENAMGYLSRSLNLFQAVRDRRGEAKALYGVARVERLRGNLVESRRQIDQAIALSEAVRADAGGQQLRASYLASVRRYYEFNIDLLMQLHQARPAEGFDAIALQASERARARGLIEMLAEAGGNIRQGVDATLLERESNLVQQLNAKAQRLTQRNLPEQLAALKQEITLLETEYEQTQAAIRKTSPRYAAITQPQPLSLGQIQQQLDSETLLLEYSLGAERSFLWAITNDSLATYELPGEEQIKQSATRVYNFLTARSLVRKGETWQQRQARIIQAEAQLPAAAGTLSKMVLGPVVAHLGDRRLVVVADGALQYIPFAILPKPGHDSAPPLIVDHEIIVLPSVSALAVQRRELAARRPAPKMLAVIADPVFSRNDERVRAGKSAPRLKVPTDRIATGRRIEHEEEKSGLTIGGFSIPRLPFTRREADRILAFAPGENLKALGYQANRAIATSAELSRYRYLHFATHGLLDSERPGLSALVLSLVDEEGKPQDGFLRAHEIYNLNLPAELVVLSACQTGLGKEIRGEGLVGLTRGFMYAGAARVVVSLWNVNDEATSELMANFYQKMLRQGQRPAAAMRAAQVEMLKAKQWQAPYYWAAFVLQGEWR